jgi:C-terminal processing protease CtpA/Prc
MFMRSPEPTRTPLARWRTARRVVLGAIVLAGSVATSATLLVRTAGHDCAITHHADRSFTYSGIGVVIEREDQQAVVRRVLPGAPAEHKLYRGARLVSVDGTTPRSLDSWAASIRGAPGTTVELEVDYPCGGTKTVTITRDVIRMHY